MDRSVLVLGGGFAGTRAAMDLADRGRRVTLLERRAAPGGRTSSFRDAATGARFDNGPHLFMGCYRAALDVLGRLGTRRHVIFPRLLRISYREAGRRRFALRCPGLPAPWHLAAGLMRFGGAPVRERLAALRVAAWLRRLPETPGGEAPPTVAALFRSLGQPPRLCETLWFPLALAVMNAPPEEADGLLFARALREMFLGAPGCERLGLYEVDLGTLLAPLGVYLRARGGALRAGGRVERILFDGMRAVGVRLAGGEELRAGAVVSAVPHDAFARLVQDEAARHALGVDRLRALGYRPILNVHLVLDRPVVREPVVGLLGTETQWLFNRSALWRGRFEPPGAGQVLSAVVSASDTLRACSPGERIERTVEDLTRHFPSLRRARVVHARVVHERRATFDARPGVDTLRPGPVSPIAGLFLAGDWTATGLPATIEGAARSGRAAAAAVQAFFR